VRAAPAGSRFFWYGSGVTSPAVLRSRASWLLATLLLAAACRPAGPPPSAPSPLAQQTVPDFARPTIAGDRIDTEQLRGKVVVIKFFAKYCEPCKHTLPAAQKLHQKHPNVAFVGVSEDEYSSDAQALVSSYGLTFPVVHDQGNVLAGRFRVSEMPVTFVIDTQGVVQWVGGPGQNEDDLAAAIEAFAG
jgi:cytochrome c biogenesis protein CcmG/thiol:disulfide interchange protein DsbE